LPGVDAAPPARVAAGGAHRHRPAQQIFNNLQPVPLRWNGGAQYGASWPAWIGPGEGIDCEAKIQAWAGAEVPLAKLDG
jgi:hypothetical protein